ncbi:MAG: hypothetical protein ACXV5Q_01390 [Frankiaceae bacterium]
MSTDDDFYRLSKALKAAGRGKTRSALARGMKKAAESLIPDVQDALRQGLPQGGGAGEFIADKKIVTKALTGQDPGVKIAVLKQDPRLESQGRLGHPAWNKYRANGKRVWAIQQVRPGIVAEALEQNGSKVVSAMEGVIQSFVDEIVKDVERG